MWKLFAIRLELDLSSKFIIVLAITLTQVNYNNKQYNVYDVT